MKGLGAASLSFIIRPVVAVFKSLASALAIDSGGSVGREGPIAQIGSAFVSTKGQLFTVFSAIMKLKLYRL
jgi:chloride channel protein, CIC family